MSNVLSIKTELDTGLLSSPKLLALRVDGSERLSRLPEYTVDLVGNASVLTGREKINLHALIGTRATVSFDVFGSKRHINGYIIKAMRGERRGRYDSYSIIMRPWLWFATRGKNSRVFQNKTVQDIVNAVLDTYGEGEYAWNLLPGTTLPTLEYCVQYDESDFDFVSRLLEEFGVYYFFKHTDKLHKLQLLNGMDQHKSRESSGAVVWSSKFDGSSRMVDWHTLEEVRALKAVVRDYDYLASATEIEASADGQTATTNLGEAEIYEFPARAVLNQAVAASQSSATAAQAVAKRLVEAAQSLQKRHSGQCNAHDMVCGATFKLENAPQSDENGQYLIVACDFQAEYGDHEAIEDLKGTKGKRDGFVGNIEAISKQGGLFRPDRSTPRPRMYGPQIAKVVGASANEIETDVNGRIKIQFPWDREGEKDENSSCWVRVAQPWAGKKMGLWMLPRIGHEVVVSFIGGDPDRPIVTGSVHNDANPPPYELPGHADVATWISHSTKDGEADANNELRFCDTTGSEHVWFQAQSAFYRHVKGDTFDHLEMNETRKVKQTVKEVVGENWYLNVGKDVMHELGKDLHTKVAGDIFTTGGATWQVKLAKDYSLKVGGDTSLDITGKTALKSAGDVNVQTDGAMNLKATGNLVSEATGKLSMKSTADVLMEGINIKAKGSAEIVLEATAGIKIVCGGSVITLGPAGVTIDGPLVKVNCGGGGGSAGAAESAAAAQPKEVADALVQEELKPEKAEDYDKLLADPLVPAEEAPGSSPGAAAVAAPPPPPGVPAAPALPAKPPAIPPGMAMGAAAAGVVAGVVAGAVAKELDDPNSILGKVVHAVTDPFADLIEVVGDGLSQAVNAVGDGIGASLDLVNEGLAITGDAALGFTEDLPGMRKKDVPKGGDDAGIGKALGDSANAEAQGRANEALAEVPPDMSEQLAAEAIAAEAVAQEAELLGAKAEVAYDEAKAAEEAAMTPEQLAQRKADQQAAEAQKARDKAAAEDPDTAEEAQAKAAESYEAAKDTEEAVKDEYHQTTRADDEKAAAAEAKAAADAQAARDAKAAEKVAAAKKKDGGAA